MAVSHLRNTPITGKSYTTPVDATPVDQIRRPVASTDALAHRRHGYRWPLSCGNVVRFCHIESTYSV